MSLKIAGQLFTGPFKLDETEIRVNQAPVVFAVISKEGQPWAPSFRLVDVGASSDAGVRFAEHPRHADWRAQAAGGAVSIYLLAMPRSQHSLADRERVVDEIRKVYNPPHGLVSA